MAVYDATKPNSAQDILEILASVRENFEALRTTNVLTPTSLRVSDDGSSSGYSRVVEVIADHSASGTGLVVWDRRAFAAGVGGAIGLGGKGSAANYYEYALITGRKENATSGDYAGYFGIFTRINGGSLLERLRVTSNGVVQMQVLESLSVGADLASAATIAPTNNVHRVTGTTGVNTITVPTNYIGGPIYLIFTGAVVIGTSGNIATGFTTVAGYTYEFTWHPTAAKWYPAKV